MLILSNNVFFLSFSCKTHNSLPCGLLVVVGGFGQKSYNETPSEVKDKSEGDNGLKRNSTFVRL